MIDIVKEAWERYPSEKKGTKGMIDSSRRKMFIEGAEWYKQQIFDELRYIIETES